LEFNLRATECHLPLLDHTCHPTQVNNALTAATHANTRFNYPRRMEGWVDLRGWLQLHIVMIDQFTDSHPSK